MAHSKVIDEIFDELVEDAPSNPFYGKFVDENGVYQSPPAISTNEYTFAARNLDLRVDKIVTWEMFQKYHEQLVDYITSRDGLTVDGEEVKEYYEHLVSELPDHIDPLMPLEFEEDVDDETID